MTTGHALAGGVVWGDTCFLMRRAKLILLFVGLCFAGTGFQALPLPQTNPEALTQSLFVRLASAGALIHPAFILICVGLGCLALAALLPSGRE